MERDREAIFQVLVLRDHEHARVTLTDAPKSPNRDARPPAVVSSRARTHYDAAPPRAAAASSSRLIHCTDGFWAYAAAGEVDGVEELAGEVYSPQRDTEAGAVVELGRALHRDVQGRLDEHDLEAALVAAESHARP